MIGEIRGKGLMIGIDFLPPKSKGIKVGWDLLHKVKEGLFGQMVVVPLLNPHRILTQVAGPNADTVKLLPTLVIDRNDVTYFLSAFEEVMKECHLPGGFLKFGAKLGFQAMRA